MRWVIVTMLIIVDLMVIVTVLWFAISHACINMITHYALTGVIQNSKTVWYWTPIWECK